jgi:hypothetical protein
MTEIRGRTVPVPLAATVLVAGANLAAFVATWQPLLSGRANSEDRGATVGDVLRARR